LISLESLDLIFLLIPESPQFFLDKEHSNHAYGTIQHEKSQSIEGRVFLAEET
jgi:hypothetical protein